MSFIYRAAIMIVLLFLGLVSTGFAQTEAEAIDTLSIDLWPDFDRPAVLVLITGSLPEDVPLPAAVTLPLQSGADINAVARISADNVMSDDIEYTVQDDQVLLNTPDRRFRVEYYFPYDEDGLDREFEFTWLADLPVNQLEMAVQQPGAASEMQTQPAAVTVGQDSRDGLNYHVLEVESVPGGTPFTVQVSYSMESPTLSANQPAPAPEELQAPPAANTGIDWPLILAGLGLGLIVAAVIWQVAANRNKRKRPRKTPPKPKPDKTAKAAKYCHECGTLLQGDDKFCRECGTAVKQK